MSLEWLILVLKHIALVVSVDGFDDVDIVIQLRNNFLIRVSRECVDRLWMLRHNSWYFRYKNKIVYVVTPFCLTRFIWFESNSNTMFWPLYVCNGIFECLYFTSFLFFWLSIVSLEFADKLIKKVLWNCSLLYLWANQVKHVIEMLIEYKHSNIPLHACNSQNIVFEFDLNHVKRVRQKGVTT